MPVEYFVYYEFLQQKLHKISFNTAKYKMYKIGNILWIWSHLLKTSLMENFIFIRYEYCGVLLLVLTARKG